MVAEAGAGPGASDCSLLARSEAVTPSLGSSLPRCWGATPGSAVHFLPLSLWTLSHESF